MTDIEILALLVKAKELGVTLEDVEAFKARQGLDGRVRLSSTVPEMKPEDIVKPLSVFDDLSEDEIKYWATPFYDQLQREKELKKQHKDSGGVE